MTTVNARIVLLNKTTAEWQNETNVPVRGTPCLEFTAEGRVKMKIGDGNKLFKELPYIADDLTAAEIIKIGRASCGKECL